MKEVRCWPGQPSVQRKNLREGEGRRFVSLSTVSGVTSPLSMVRLHR